MIQDKKNILSLLIFSLFNYGLVNSQISKCNTNPCRNGGRCVDQANTAFGYSCLCINPWMGVNCDQSPNGQQNNGIFPNNNQGFNSNLGGFNTNNNNNNPQGFNNNFGALNPAVNSNNNPGYNTNSNLGFNNNNNNNNLGAFGNTNNNNNNQGFNNILGSLGSANNNNPGFFNSPGGMNNNNNNNNNKNNFNNPMPWNSNTNNNNNQLWNNNPMNGVANTFSTYKTVAAWNNDRNTSPLYNVGGWDQRATTPYYNSGNLGYSNNNQISGCSSSPCLNGATCQPYGPWGFKCSCGPNYYGYRCERFYKAMINGASNLANQATKLISLIIVTACFKYF